MSSATNALPGYVLRRYGEVVANRIVSRDFVLRDKSREVLCGG